MSTIGGSKAEKKAQRDQDWERCMMIGLLASLVATTMMFWTGALDLAVLIQQLEGLKPSFLR